MVAWTRYALMRGELRPHETRRAILARLTQTPGLRVGTLAHELGVDQKTALHHARALERAGELRLAREGRWLRCYLPGFPQARRDTREDVLQSLPATSADLARALRIPRGTAWSLLRSLERAGLARREGAAWLGLQEKAPMGPQWRPSNCGR